MRLNAIVAVVIAMTVGCAERGRSVSSGPSLADAPISVAADRTMLSISAGEFVSGSTAAEREAAYESYRLTSGHDAARRNQWFDREQPREVRRLPGFRIDRTAVAMAAFAEFVATTKTRGPTVSEAVWAKQGFAQEYATEVVRFNWNGDQPPSGRGPQPVVLVTAAEAEAYCAWRGRLVGETRTLPTALQFERAARGKQGAEYPWGDGFDPKKLNSGVDGPNDLTAADSHPEFASPDGVIGLAGNVFQWTASEWPWTQGRRTVKGSAWEDYGGLGRGASQHGRLPTIRHAIIGFRCSSPVG